MTDPTIICPNCKTEIRLTESLAAPMLAATRKQFEQQLAQKDADVAKREQGLRDKEKQLAEVKRTLDEQVADQVAAQLKAERTGASLSQTTVQAEIVRRVQELVTPAQVELLPAEGPSVEDIVKKTVAVVVEHTIDIPRILVKPRGSRP